jgi:hypothetical protein
MKKLDDWDEQEGSGERRGEEKATERRETSGWRPSRG